MKKITLTIILFLTVKLFLSQEINWVKSFGGILNDEGRIQKIDDNGNIYSIGNFIGNVDFDPNSPTEMISSNGQNDFYIQKLDSSGNFLWAKTIGGSLNDEVWSLDLDNNGNIIICGSFNGIVDFDPSLSFSNSLSSNGNYDLFILKLSENGDFVNAISLGGSYYDGASSVFLDSDGEIYVTGVFEGVVDFNPSLDVENLTSNGQMDVFVLKLTPNLELTWVKSFGGIQYDEGLSIHVDQHNNVYVTGYYEDSVDFDLGTNIELHVSNGDRDIYLLKLNEQGDFEFVYTAGAGGLHYDLGFDVKTDSELNVYVLGTFFSNVDFDMSNEEFILNTNGESAFLLKLTPTGNFIWVKSFDTYDLELSTFLINQCDDIYLVGDYRDSIDLNPGSETNIYSSIGNNDLFLVKLDSSGNFIWGKNFGGSTTFNGGLDDRSLSQDQNGNLYIYGYFWNSLYFNDFNDSIVSLGSSDIFIIKLKDSTFCKMNINSYDELNNITPNIYPNPTKDIIHISGISQDELSSVIIYNQLGEKLYETKSIELDLSKLENGQYHLMMNTKSQIMFEKIYLIK